MMPCHGVQSLTMACGEETRKTNFASLVEQKTHPGCLLTSPLSSSEGFNYPLFLRGATSDEFQRATKILERAKGNNSIVYHGSLEKSMEESYCNLEASNVIPEVLAGMLEPNSKTSKQTRLLHEMLEKQKWTTMSKK
eukprot:scaffold5444_cov63-Attheya_sp.AAC.4